MRSLTFTGHSESIDGRRIRHAVFEERSLFTVPAACLVANAIRDALAALLDADVDLRLLAPVIPSLRAWPAITQGAALFRLTGSRNDIAVIVRPDACVQLACAAFGESPARDVRELSAIEMRVLERLVSALAPAFGPVCGFPGAVDVQRVSQLAGFATYFEIQIERPVAARVGIALARDPQPEAAQGLSIEHLSDIEVDVRVRTEGLAIPAYELAAIEPGAIVPITLSTGLVGIATVAGGPVARGECGVQGNRLALAVGPSPCTTRE